MMNILNNAVAILLAGKIVVPAGIFLVCCFFGSFFTVEQQTKRVVTRLGKFNRIAGPGLNFKLPFFEQVSEPISLRVRQLELSEVSYTDKGTSVTVTANVQYQVDDNASSVRDAFYKLENPEEQIKSHVSSSIRGKVPQMSLEEIQMNQSAIAGHVKGELIAIMSEYGYTITDVLITKVAPDATIVKANNAKYASAQGLVTAKNLAEAKFAKTTKDAQAEKESSVTRGRGLAGERKAVISGLRESVQNFEEGVPGTTAKDAMTLLAFEQAVDAQVRIATAAGAKVLFVPSGAGAAIETLEQIRALFPVSEDSQKA